MQKNKNAYCSTENTHRLPFSKESPILLILNEAPPHRLHLQNVLSKHAPSKKIIYCHSKELLTTKDLLSKLSLHTPSFSPSSKTKLKQQLTQIINYYQKKDLQFLLVIAQSESLSLDVLAALSHLGTLQEESHLQIPIILSGTPKVREKMFRLQSQPPPFIHFSKLESTKPHTTFSQKKLTLIFPFKRIMHSLKLHQQKFYKPATACLSITLALFVGGYFILPYCLQKKQPIHLKSHHLTQWAKHSLHVNQNKRSQKTHHKPFQTHHKFRKKLHQSTSRPSSKTT